MKGWYTEMENISRYSTLIEKIKKSPSKNAIIRHLSAIKATGQIDSLSEKILAALDVNLSDKERNNLEFAFEFLNSDKEKSPAEKLMKEFFQLSSDQADLLPEKVAALPRENLSNFLLASTKYFDFKKETELQSVLVLVGKVLKIIIDKSIFSLPLCFAVDQMGNHLSSMAKIVQADPYHMVTRFPDYLQPNTQQAIDDIFDIYLDFSTMIEKHLRVLVKRNSSQFVQNMVEIIIEKFNYRYLASFYLVLEKILLEEKLYIRYIRKVSNLLFVDKYQDLAKIILRMKNILTFSSMHISYDLDVPIPVRCANEIFQALNLEPEDENYGDLIHCWYSLKRMIYHTAGNDLPYLLRPLCLNELSAKYKSTPNYDKGVAMLAHLLNHIKRNAIGVALVDYVKSAKVVFDPRDPQYPAITDPGDEKKLLNKCAVTNNKPSIEIITLDQKFQNFQFDDDYLVICQSDYEDFTNFSKKALINNTEEQLEIIELIKKFEIPLAEFARQLIQEIRDYSLRQVKFEEFFLADIELAIPFGISGFRFHKTQFANAIRTIDKEVRGLIEVYHYVGLNDKISDVITYGEDNNLVYENQYQLFSRVLALTYLHERCVPELGIKIKVKKEQKDTPKVVAKTPGDDEEPKRKKPTRIKRRIIPLYYDEYSPDIPRPTIEVEYDEEGEPKGTCRCAHWRRLPWNSKRSQANIKNWTDDSNQLPYPKLRPEWVYPDDKPFQFTWVRKSKPTRIARKKSDGYYPNEGYILVRGDTATQQLEKIFSLKYEK